LTAPDSDRFETIARHARVEIPKIKGSRFIADAFPAKDENDAKKAIARVAHEFADASHHCFAFSVDSGRTERSSDAGEPGGTAGPPILRQIESSALSDILVVVTRYYGGTNLGKGGLIRAYGSAAKAVLAECPRLVKVQEMRVQVRFDYNDTSAAMQTIEGFNGRVVSSEYGSDTRLVVAVPASRITAFQTGFREALGNRGLVEKL
jgi:uncharacterized YigZ family protein